MLPFTNMSGDPEQEYFSDGITEDIITDLSKISACSVIARNTVFTYKGKPIEVQEVSAGASASDRLEGSVRKVGQRVRINGQLIDGKDGGHLWADRYDRDLTDIFAIQDEITAHDRRATEGKAAAGGEKDRGRRQPKTSRPTRTTFKAASSSTGTRDVLRRSARRMFSKAVELDPLYARAYAGIADCNSFLFLHYYENISIESILATSAKALDLEGGLSEAHASRALALSLAERYPEAETEFERAIALNPNLYEAHYFFARASFAQGKFDQAARLYERAVEIKPDDYQSLILLIQIYRSLGRDEDIIDAARAGIKLAEGELAMHPDNPRPAYLGAIALVEIGEIARAREWTSRALAIDPDDVLTQYNAACLYSLLEDAEPALDLLARLLPQANHETKAWVKQDSDFANLHNHPRWQKIVELTT